MALALGAVRATGTAGANGVGAGVCASVWINRTSGYVCSVVRGVPDDNLRFQRGNFFIAPYRRQMARYKGPRQSAEWTVPPTGLISRDDDCQ
jgi:hypothetical protein